MNNLIVSIGQKDDHVSLNIKKSGKMFPIKTLTQDEKQSITNMLNAVLKCISKC